MGALSRSLLAGLAGLFFCACGAKWGADSSSSPSALDPGSARITGSLPGLSLATDDGPAIVRANLPTLQVKLAPSALTCGATQDSDRVTIDIGSAQPGTFTVVKGYPSSTSLAAFQARAHACPGGNQGQTGACYEQVVGGTVTITRVDDPGGFIDGTFDVTFSSGEISGSFSARRCD
jgi:hypothetical protein